MKLFTVELNLFGGVNTLMAYYHISKKSGPSICRARPGSCPFGSNAPHFPTITAAQTHYEQGLARQYGHVPVVRKTMKYRFYNRIDSSPRSKQIHRTLSVLHTTGKIGLAATTAATNLATATVKFAFSTVSRSVMPRGRKMNMKKLLMTKYWLPDIHSNKWR